MSAILFIEEIFNAVGMRNFAPSTERTSLGVVGRVGAEDGASFAGIKSLKLAAPGYLHSPHPAMAENRLMISKNILPTFTPSFLALLLGLSTACSSEAEPDPGPETNPWNGKTYLLDVTERDWAEPRGIGSEIDNFVPNFLMRIEGESPDTFDVVMATATPDGVQDPCNLTSMVTGTRGADGVAIGPTEFPLHIQHTEEPVAVDGPIYDFKLTNVLPRGRALSEEGELVATMDFRDIYELFTLIDNPTPELVCQELGGMYGDCVPCPNDGEPFCLTVKAIYLGAAPTDTAIEPIDAIDEAACTPTPE